MIQRWEPGSNPLLKKLLLAHPYAIVALLLFSILSTIFSIASPLILGRLIDTVLVEKNTIFLIPLLLLICGLFVISAIAGYYSTNLRGKLNLLLYRELANDLFGTIQEATLSEVQKIKTGDMMTRTTSNANAAVQSVTSTIPNIVVTVFGIVTPFVIMLTLNPKLALIALSPVFLVVIASVHYGGLTKKYQRNSLDSAAGMNAFLKEAYSVLPLTKVYLLERWIQDKFETYMAKYYDASWDSIRVSSMSSSVGMLIYSIPTILVLTFGSLAVLEGSMTVGTFTAFIGYTGLFFSPIQLLSLYWTTYMGSLASFDRIGEVLSLKKEHWGSHDLVPPAETIEFRKVHFNYDTRVILRDFSASFRKGRNYVTGDNGSGKSTLIKLMCGLYRPDKGKILVDGQDLSSLSRESLRQSVSVIFPDALIFDGTIYENILIGNISASREDIIHAAKKAEVDAFVRGLPEQYETQVGEAGLNLSSGEKQKIALARVILRDSSVIVFDEFTRSIDTESKRSILSVIRKMENKILIIITHDQNEIETGCNLVEVTKINNSLSYGTIKGTKSEPPALHI